MSDISRAKMYAILQQSNLQIHSAGQPPKRVIIVLLSYLCNIRVNGISSFIFSLSKIRISINKKFLGFVFYIVYCTVLNIYINKEDCLCLCPSVSMHSHSFQDTELKLCR